jgi:hypothetical protein
MSGKEIDLLRPFHHVGGSDPGQPSYEIPKIYFVRAVEGFPPSPAGTRIRTNRMGLFDDTALRWHTAAETISHTKRKKVHDLYPQRFLSDVLNITSELIETQAESEILKFPKDGLHEIFSKATLLCEITQIYRKASQPIEDGKVVYLMPRDAREALHYNARWDQGMIISDPAMAIDHFRHVINDLFYSRDDFKTDYALYRLENGQRRICYMDQSSPAPSR